VKDILQIDYILLILAVCAELRCLSGHTHLTHLNVLIGPSISYNQAS